METVGTGQSEVEVVGVADTVVLVLMPGSGDSIQALKAGIMEIPDVIAVNKGDHPAAKTMVNEVRSILALDAERAWKPPIVLTEAVRDEGIDELWERVEEHRAYLETENLLEERRRAASRRRGARRRVGACASPSGAQRAGRPGAPAAARGRRGARARPAERGARDPRPGVQDR